MHCIAVCCSVLQCVAVCCRCCSELQCAAVCCRVLQGVARCCSVLLCVVVYRNMWQCEFSSPVAMSAWAYSSVSVCFSVI